MANQCKCNSRINCYWRVKGHFAFQEFLRFLTTQLAYGPVGLEKLQTVLSLMVSSQSRSGCSTASSILPVCLAAELYSLFSYHMQVRHSKLIMAAEPLAAMTMRSLQCDDIVLKAGRSGPGFWQNVAVWSIIFACGHKC